METFFGMMPDGGAKVFKIAARAAAIAAMLSIRPAVCPFTSESVLLPHQSFSRLMRFLNFRMAGMLSSAASSTPNRSRSLERI
jgi:hypothetical protein